MRKEKDWKRTLAYKLFEERHSVDGSEGMDYLWEIYEIDSKRQGNYIKNKKNHGIGVECFEEEGEKRNVEMYCLKDVIMLEREKNMGMGKSSNLVRFSKAFKGIGWLHHVTTHGNKRVPPR